MRALKVLVIVMGVALVAGMVALVAAIVVKVEHRGAAAAATGAAPFHAALPAGSRIVATEFSGDRVLVHVVLAGGGEALYLFDARTGAELGVVDAAPGR
jgi:hypothetical protein